MTKHEPRAALRRLPAPEPSPDLLQRILRSRTLGRRIAAPAREAFTAWRWIAVAAAAALLIGGSWGVSLYLSRLGESSEARDRLDELLRDARWWTSSDVTEGAHRKIPAPAYPLIERDALDPSRVTAGVWTYRSEKTTDDILTEPEGENRIRLAQTTYAGQPVWIVSTGRRSRAEGWSPYVDTTYLDAASLRPLRAFALTNRGRTRIEQTFSADSGHESLDLTGSMKKSWRGAIAFPFPSTVLFLNDWWTNHLSALFPAFPLRRGWRGSLYQVAFISRLESRSATPLDLRVVGTERVTVPAGTFDCWRLEVETHIWDVDRFRMWVSRDKGWLIKERYRGSDYVTERVLESYEPLE